MDYIPLVTLLLATVLHLNTLSANFAYDDSRAIQKNPDLLPETSLWNLFYNDFWGTPLLHSGSHKSYRPLCVLTFRLNYLLGQLNPWGYHFGNIVCHAITTYLFTVLARILLPSQLAALTAGLLFASHPIHTEAVAGIVGRADVLACAFFLLTLLSYVKYIEARSSDTPMLRWLFACLVLLLTTAAMLSKEQALTVLAVCATFEVFVAHRASFTDLFTCKTFTQAKYKSLLEGLAMLTIFGTTLLTFRIYFMGKNPPEFAPSDNPASDSDSLLTRTLTYHYLPSANLWMVLCPNVLSFDWSMEAVPLVESLNDLRNVSTLIFYASFLYVFLKVFNAIEHQDNSMSSSYIKDEKRKNGLHVLSSTNKESIVNTIPGTSYGNIPHSNGFSKSNKHSKSTSSLLHSQCLTNDRTGTSNDVLVNKSSHFYSSRIRPVDVIILSLAIIVFPFIPASNLFFYVGFVIAERILYIPSMGVCLLVGFGVDVLYRSSGSNFRKRLVLVSLGLLVMVFSVKTMLRNLDWQTEERLYTAGINVNPAKAWGNLANVYNDKEEVQKAEMAYKKALSYRPNMADVYYNLGVLQQGQNRSNEAMENYQKAINFRPKLSVAHLNLGIVTAQRGDTEQAKKIYIHCADLDTSGLKDPRLHDGTKISCLFNLGRILMDEDKLQESLDIFNKALQRRPDHYQPQSIYNMIGEVYFKMDQLDAAEKFYLTALKVKPDHLPAHLTMAKLMKRKELYAEAERWLIQAKKYNPTDVSVDFHRAQLLASWNKHEEAITIFERILPQLSHDFDAVYTAANVYREMDRKQKAEELYVAASKLRPNEPTAWMNLGAMLHINGKYDQAEKAYLRGLELRPNDKVTMNNLQRLKNLQNKKG